jgi:hypothetical protein
VRRAAVSMACAYRTSIAWKSTPILFNTRFCKGVWPAQTQVCMAQFAVVALLVLCSHPICPVVAAGAIAPRPALASPSHVVAPPRLGQVPPAGAVAVGLPELQARSVQDALGQQVRQAPAKRQKGTRPTTYNHPGARSNSEISALCRSKITYTHALSISRIL